MNILTEYQYVHITDIVIKETYIIGADRGNLFNRLHKPNLRRNRCNPSMADAK